MILLKKMYNRSNKNDFSANKVCFCPRGIGRHKWFFKKKCITEVTEVTEMTFQLTR
jgi:hypothetical protein